MSKNKASLKRYHQALQNKIQEIFGTNPKLVEIICFSMTEYITNPEVFDENHEAWNLLPSYIKASTRDLLDMLRDRAATEKSFSFNAMEKTLLGKDGRLQDCNHGEKLMQFLTTTGILYKCVEEWVQHVDWPLSEIYTALRVLTLTDRCLQSATHRMNADVKANLVYYVIEALLVIYALGRYGILLLVRDVTAEIPYDHCDVGFEDAVRGLTSAGKALDEGRILYNMHILRISGITFVSNYLIKMQMVAEWNNPSARRFMNSLHALRIWHYEKKAKYDALMKQVPERVDLGDTSPDKAVKYSSEDLPGLEVRAMDFMVGTTRYLMITGGDKETSLEHYWIYNITTAKLLLSDSLSITVDDDGNIDIIADTVVWRKVLNEYASLLKRGFPLCEECEV
jgi:hypothetical protein